MILLLTLGLSILAHAAVLLWGNSDADTTKLPGQRLQVQVAVASKPAATPEDETPRELVEPVEKTTQPSLAAANYVDKAPEEQPVQKAKSSEKQVAVLSAKPAPVSQTTAKVMVPAPFPDSDVSAVKPESASVEESAEPEQSVAKVEKPVPLTKTEPVKNQVIQPQVEAVAESSNTPQVEIPAQAETALESAQTQPASFQAAQVRKQTKPHYPRLARRRGQEGTVWLRAQVDSTGKALAIEIDRSSGFEILDKAALKAVRSWRFLPALQDGQAQASYVKIPVKFQLDNAR